MTYLWVKTLHIVFVISWFAGLFYLPRIYVNLAQQNDAQCSQLLLGMAKRLLRFTTFIAVIAVFLGLCLIYWIGFKHTWLHIKLLLVLFTIIYHFLCFKHYQRLSSQTNNKSHVYYRWFNEIPVFLLLGIIAMVIFRPF